MSRSSMSSRGSVGSGGPSAAGSNIHVVVRKRPMTETEAAEGEDAVHVQGRKISVTQVVGRKELVSPWP